MFPTDVMIVGAGPVGLAAACELTRHGLRVRVVEKAAGPSVHSKALGVHARTMEMFEKLGLADRFLAEGLPMPWAALYDRDRPLVRPTLDGIDTAYPFVLSIPQSRTEELLADHFRSQGGSVEWNTELTGLTEEAGAVGVTLRGPDGSVERAEIPWLIGCDGAHSTVRKLLGIEFVGERASEWFGLADVEVDWDFPREVPVVFLTGRGPFATFPLPGGRLTRLIAQLDAGPGEKPDPDLDDFRRMFHERIGARAEFRDPVWISAFQISVRLVREYRRGRAFLAGDAAHIHSPVGGRGMNTGIQDAFNLAWKLALVRRGLAPDSLLDSYHAERYPIGAETLRQTGLATRMLTARNPVLRWVRKRLMRFVLGRGFLRRRIVRYLTMLSTRYSDSPIVGPSSSGRSGKRPRPGERAPDGDHGGGRVTEFFRSTNHVLLIFGRPGPGAESAGPFADRIDVRHLNVGTEAAERYAARAGSAFLVRPDGHVAWSSDAFDPAELWAWLDGRIFTGPA